LDIASGDLKVGSGITLASGGTITAANFSGNGSGLTQVNSDQGSWVNGASSNIHLAVSTDKVGIGTVSPDEKLHVNGNIRLGGPQGTDEDASYYIKSAGQIHINSATDGAADDSYICLDLRSGQSGSNRSGIGICGAATNTTYQHIAFETTDAERMRINYDGNVGIGTVTPQTTLHVKDVSTPTGTGDAFVGGLVGNTANRKPTECLRLTGQYVDSAGSGSLLRFTNYHTGGTNPNTNEYNTAGIAGFDFNNSWGGGLVLYTAAGTSGGGDLTPRMIINNDGDVGIGTNPNEKLDINGGNIRLNSTGTAKIFNHSAGSDYGNLQISSGYQNAAAAPKIDLIGYTGAATVDGDNLIKFSTNNSVRMFINQSGNVGVGTTTPGAIFDVQGNATSPIKKTAPTASTGTYNFVLSGPRPGTSSAGATHFINGSTRSQDGGANTYTIRNDSGPLRLGHGSYTTSIAGILEASSTITLSTSSSIRQSSSTWTGNPGTYGKLEYHNRTWYAVSGSNSYNIMIFRRDGSDQSFISNEGNLMRTSHSNGYLVGSYDNVGANSYKTNPIYTIGNNYRPNDTSLGVMYGIGYSHGNFTAALRSNEGYGWGLYVAADGNARIGLNGGTGSIKMICEENGDSYAWEPANDGWLRLQGNASGQGNMSGDYTSLAVGNFYAAGATRFSSDDRVKHFEEEIPNALELIQQLKPYKYKKTTKIYDENYTGDIGEDWEWEIGLIAQDVEKIPYLEHTVSKPEDGAEGKYSLNYTQFIGVCIQGIKDLGKELDEQNQKLESRVTLLETALTSVYNDINRDWVRYEKVDPKPKNVSIPAEVSNYLVKLGWACALIKEGREVTFQSGRTAKVKEVLDQKNFTVDRSLVDGQDTLERVAVETIKKDGLLNVAVSTVREVSEAILDESVLKKVDDRLAVLDARLAALENM
tara:strand:- start:224 stop:3004 length:2781 start_codon:yes stop_codon:yes gene_type:complete